MGIIAHLRRVSQHEKQTPRQLVIRPYRVVYEPTETTCDILDVMRCSHLIGRASLGLG